MKIKLLTALSTLKGSYSAGEEIEISDKEAKALIKKGLAEPVKRVRRATKNSK